MQKSYSDLQKFIDDLHEKTSVQQIALDMGIVQKSDFKRANFVCCLFHNEKTSSMQISKNFWKCYGCGAAGDIIELVKRYFSLDFYEAVQKIADHLNIEIKGAKYRVDKRYEILRNKWEQYLSAMDTAPIDVKNARRDFFPQEVGYDDKDRDGKFFVFPLTSKSGAILGFTKRRIDFLCEKDENGNFKAPKWKHSSLKDSLVNLCHNMFNLNNAWKEIKSKHSIIITEGPKDVIAYLRIGLKNAICVCGTGNSINVWDELLPLEEIILSYDADDAGTKALISTLNFLTSKTDIKSIYSITLPYGEDPYSVSRSELQKFYDDRTLAINSFVEKATAVQVKELYDNTPEYNKMFVMKTICKVKGFSLKEAESWLNSSKIEEKKTEQLSEKEHLLAIVNCENKNVSLIPIDKAKRILELKYGIIT